MQTNKIAVSNSGTGVDEALREVERFAEYQHLTHKEALRLRLLAEEMMGMVKGIVGDFVAEFWVQGEGKNTELHLQAHTALDLEKREELLAVSSTGKNAASRGVMGKLRDLFEEYMLLYDEIGRSGADALPGMLAYDDMLGVGMDWVAHSWSMERYRTGVSDRMGESESAAQAWDEMEKSIVGKLADDVTVGMTGNKVEMTVRKQF